MKLSLKLLPLLALMPVAAFAAAGDLKGVDTFLTNIVKFMNGTLVPLVFAIAFLFFLWGVFNYFIRGAGDESSRETGREFMLYAIIGFVLMVSIWGIVNLLGEGFGLQDENLNKIPNVELKN